MKQKLAIGVIILLIVLVGLLLIFNGTAGTKTKFFEDTNYPVTVVTKKSGMTVTIKSKTNQDIPWTVVISDPAIAEINLKGNKKADSEKYKVTALKEGTTYIHMEKVQQAFGYEQLMVSIDIPISISANGDKYTLSLMEGESLYLGGSNMVANNSEFPFILKSNGAAADIAFINGINDWTIDTMDAPVRYEIGPGSDNETIVRLFYQPKEEELGEGEEATSEDNEEETVIDLTQDEGYQKYMEETFGTPPEGLTYENLVFPITLQDFELNPELRIYTEEGEDITETYIGILEGRIDPVTGEAISGTETTEEEPEATEETEATEESEVVEETVEETEEVPAAKEEEATSEDNGETSSEEEEVLTPEDIIITKISFHSDSLNETVYIDIMIDPMGNLYLSKGDAPN